MPQPKKILVLKPKAGNGGGITALYERVAERIDPERFTLDIRSLYRTCGQEKGTRESGIDSAKPSFREMRRRFAAILSEEEYDLIHINAGSRRFHAEMCRVAQKMGRGPVIVHSHNDLPVKPWKRIFARRMKDYIAAHADYLVACSGAAGDSLFPEGAKREILWNGIDYAPFWEAAGNREENRRTILRELGIQASSALSVVGHCGRFMPQKNHDFLLRFFAEYAKDREAVLLLAGTGPGRPSAEKEAEELGIKNKVFFLDARNDMPRLYSMMDLFVFPSLYEGLPLSVIEAQASGTPVLMSDRITPEVMMQDFPAIQLSLSDGMEEWCRAADDLQEDSRAYTPGRDPRFSLDRMVNRLEEIYDTVIAGYGAEADARKN